MVDQAILDRRIAWIMRKHEEKRSSADFENGFRAGLDCALTALQGRDILGQSIDIPVPPKKRRTREGKVSIDECG